MAAISALMVNDTVMRREPYDEDRTPTTPRAVARMLSPSRAHQNMALEQPTLDTTDTSSPSPQHSSPSAQSKSNDLKRGPTDDDSDSMDIDHNQDDPDASDNDTEQGESGAASRKKKGQRFFCTGYPPCNLSFTRSEHLARHIRKHTGERPFQCHCNRRFSRLDNLRQHAQTVHVNEEIPTDSLAATGTRFQRQIRTDRVRPAGRPRSGTMSSTGTHSRGHSRNLSTSSIGSTSSNYSTSTVDPRRRPAPLIMAGDGRPKLGVEPPSTPPPAQFGSYATYSPGDIPTPTSATLSVTPGSPAFGSPAPSASRVILFAGSRSPGRRLSVPSAAPHPFPSPCPPPFPSYPNPAGVSSTTVSSNNSTITSPTTSTFSFASTSHNTATEDWRRRTWHPSTYSGVSLYARPATSGLTYSQTPDAPQPAFAPNATAAAGQAPRLPGIESFDHVQQRPSTPPRQQSGGPAMDSSRLPGLMPPAEFDSRIHSLGQSHGRGPVHGHRRHISADVPRYGRYTGYGDRGFMERPSASWMHDTGDRLQQATGRPLNRGSEGVKYSMAPPTTSAGASPSHFSGHDAQHGRISGGPSARPTWNPPSGTVRTSPEDSGSSEGVPTPGTSTTDVNPAIMPASGILDAHSAPLPPESNHNPCFAAPPSLTTIANRTSTAGNTRESLPRHGHSRSNSDMNRLDALAAVATIENHAATRQ